MKSPPLSFLLACLILVMAINTQGQTIRYVKVNGTGNGTSWADPSGDFQAMIDASSPDDQVWVAKGTYNTYSNGVLSMKSGVKLYGGFSGEETSLNQRNWGVNATILIPPSTPQPGGPADQKYVFDNVDVDNNALLDGFTITGSKSRSAMTNSDSSPTIMNVVFTENSSSIGGAMYNLNSSPILINVIFSGNSARHMGGAIYNNNSSPSVINTIFFKNYAFKLSPRDGTCGCGGALASFGDSNPVITNAVFVDNSATGANSPFMYPRNDVYGNAAIINHSYSDVKLNDGTGNVYENRGPAVSNPTNISFANLSQPLGPDNLWMTADDGLHWRTGAMGIDAGSNEALPSGRTARVNAITTDITGAERIQGSTVDIGPYEGLSILPVTLISFTGRLQEDHTVELHWKTASEVNASHFEVQRSLDARTFESLGQVKAASSGGYSYNYIDRTPLLSGYYRLKMIDLDETFAYSSIIAIKGAGTVASVRIGPNPAIDMININLADMNLLHTEVEIFDVHGKLLDCTLLKETNQSIPIRGYISGIYILKFANGEKFKVIKND